MISRHALALMTSAIAAAVNARAAPFDLPGPMVDAHVIRQGVTLPISEVPNLAVGDQLWIKADFPSTQSSRYLMVIAFLSGSTNPPPQSWFAPCKTWTGDCAQHGLKVAVPAGAEQVLLFLAPQTRGDFNTLIGAVRGRPGIFVRTSQDLNQAALDRSRLERYLSEIRRLIDNDPAKIKAAAPLMARSLGIKIDEKCMDRVPALQAPCLMQEHDSLILTDGHSTSIVEALTSGPGSDLAMEAGDTPQLSHGYYGPYIASILDIARIFDSFHLAQYQYIPALSTQRGDRLELVLNTAPSFQNPKSVLVTALPAVEEAQLPPLRAVDPKKIYCAKRTSLVLPVEGAPLVFSTHYAHDMHLRLSAGDGKFIDLPAAADPLNGGYVVDMAGLGAAELSDSLQASLRGRWGFDSYEGPSFRLINSHKLAWELAAGDAASMIVGREDTLHLRADSVSCIDAIMLKDPSGKEIKVAWKTPKPDEIEVKLPLQTATPGTMTLMVTQTGIPQPQSIPIMALSEIGKLDGFTIHAGDTQGVLKGTRLDAVTELSIGPLNFFPAPLFTEKRGDELTMIAQEAQAVSVLKPGPLPTIKATLRDGRVLSVPGSVETPRPRVVLINKRVQRSPIEDNGNIRLVESELPQNAALIFSVRTQSPAAFSRDTSIEVATPDHSITTRLSMGNGMILENSSVAVLTLSPSKSFGPSVFGPLQFRVIANGVAGDWQALADVVRLPEISKIKCPAAEPRGCELRGSNLYLIDSVATDPSFLNSVHVPDGFLGTSLLVPHTTSGPLYLKLRDDPTVINQSSLEIETHMESQDASVETQSQPAAATMDVSSGTSLP